MRERLLNGFLALQVAFSVALTGFLLFGTGAAALQADAPVVHPVVSADQRPPDVLQPRLIWTHQGNGEYAGFQQTDIMFGVFWQEMRGVLARSLARPNDYVSGNRRQLDDAAGEPLVGIDLEFALPPGQWARLLGYPRTVDPLQPTVDRVVFSLGEEGRVFLIGPAVPLRVGPLSDWDRRQMLRLVQRVPPATYAAYVPLAGIEQAGLTVSPLAPATGHAVGSRGGLSGQRLDLGLLVDPWVMVPKGPVQVSSPTYVPEPPLPGPLVSQFFVDLTVVREVEEQDATAFIGGQRALRIYPYGGVEFWDFGEMAAAPVANPEPEEVMQVVQEFLSRRNLWQPGVTLSQYITTPDGVELTFRYHYDGLPWESRQRLMEVRLAGNRVTYLYRSPDYVAQDQTAPETVADPDVALQFVAELSRKTGVRVRAVELAHRVYRSRTVQTVIPVWVVRLSNDETIMVDARTGFFRW